MSRFRLVTFRHATLAILAGCLFFCAPDAIGQDVTELSLKAAFIHNFLKFTEWPKDVLAPAAPLAVCVLGDAAFGDVLQNYVKGHPVDGHEIVVSHIASDAKPRLCHLLYVSGITARQAAQVVVALNDSPVLTLSDIDPFARIGGMAQLYVQDGRIRFRINLDNTKRSRLNFSSRLLSLATLVKDDPNALR
jgi:YfiR/HmsC-like